MTGLREINKSLEAYRHFLLNSDFRLLSTFSGEFA